MSALSRNKGAAYERRISNMLTEATGTRWRRRVRNHEGDSDVVADDPAFERISVECKHANTLCLPAWWRQAQAQAGETRIPMLVYKRTGMAGDLVMLDAHDVNPRTFPCGGATRSRWTGLQRCNGCGKSCLRKSLFLRASTDATHRIVGRRPLVELGALVLVRPDRGQHGPVHPGRG